jgi:hypothetical protein
MRLVSEALKKAAAAVKALLITTHDVELINACFTSKYELPLTHAG